MVKKNYFKRFIEIFKFVLKSENERESICDAYDWSNFAHNQLNFRIYKIQNKNKNERIVENLQISGILEPSESDWLKAEYMIDKQYHDGLLDGLYNYTKGGLNG